MISPLLAIIHKEWRHIIRDKGTLFIVLIVPVLLSVALSLILSTDVRTVKMVAVVPHHSEVSRSLISRFENNPVFRFKGYVSNLDEAEKLMRVNKINAAIVFDPDFESSHSVQIVIDASNCTMGSAASIYIRAIIDSELSEQSENLISCRMLYNPRLLSTYSFQPGIIAFVILLVVLVLNSASLVREKQFGTIDSVTLSPTSINAFYIGKSIPYSAIGLLVGCITLVVGVLITGIPVRGSFFAIFLVTALYIFTTMCLGMYIALITSSQVNVFAICWSGIIMPVIYFGGVFVPVDNLPDWGHKISGFIYVRWYVDALRKLLIQGVDTIYIVKDVLFMSISTLVFGFACQFKLKRIGK